MLKLDVVKQYYLWIERFNSYVSKQMNHPKHTHRTACDKNNHMYTLCEIFTTQH